MNDSHVTGKMKTEKKPLASRYIQILMSNMDMYKRIIFLQSGVIVESMQSVLRSQHGVEHFERFLQHTSQLLCCDNGALVWVI